MRNNNHRAIISLYIDDCVDTDEAMRFVRLLNAAAERIQRMFGKRILFNGCVAEAERVSLPYAGN